MPGGGTGMVMLPPGYMPGMTGAFPAQMMPVPSQPQPPPQRGFLWKDILVGILAAVTVVAVVLIGKLALTPGRGSIILTVLPPRSAEVLLDNKPVGRVQPGGSLLLSEVPRGAHRLRVRAEDGEGQQVVNVTSAEPVQLTVQLQQAAGTAQGSGTIKLKVPLGSLVSIDGRLVSEKDAQKGYLVTAGTPHEVMVKKPGMRDQRLTLTVAAGGEEERQIDLQPARGKLVVTTAKFGFSVLAMRSKSTPLRELLAKNDRAGLVTRAGIVGLGLAARATGLGNRVQVVARWS